MKKPIRVQKLMHMVSQELIQHLELESLNPNTLIFFTLERPIAYKKKPKERAPKHLGSGMFHHTLFDKAVKGDKFFDVDLGMMVYDGEQWLTNAQLTMKEEKG